MENSSFIKELQESVTTKNKEQELLKTLKNELNFLAKAIAQREVDEIKAQMKEQAIAGIYKIVKGKKTIMDEHSLSCFVPNKLDSKELIPEIVFRRIKTDGLCNISNEHLGAFFEASLYWSSKVSRRLAIWQMILIPITLGLFGLACLFGDPTGDFSGPRVYRGKIQADYLTKKTCTLIKNQLKKEGISLDKIIISYPKYHDGSFEERIEFKDINEEKIMCTQRPKSAKFKKGETFTACRHITLSCSIIID